MRGKRSETGREGVVGAREEPLASAASFDALMNCINHILGDDESLYDLEITPAESWEREMSAEGQAVMELREVLESLDSVLGSRRKEEAVETTPDAGGCRVLQESNIASVLMEGIDLHVELENYIRAIDLLNPGRNRTRNTVQSSLSLRKLTDEYLDVVEVKSSSTFASASSVCAQHDGDTKGLHVFLERRHNMESVSEEELDPRSARGCLSQTQLSDKMEDVRKIKSDNEPRKSPQESKLKSSIKRSFGKTSFQSFRTDEQSCSSVGSEGSIDMSSDSYEKILPFITPPSKSGDEVRERSSLLFANSVCSPSVESLSASARKASSDWDRWADWPEQAVRTHAREGVASSRNVILGDVSQQESDGWKWSPTLQELIDIYGNVLKQNKKLNNNSRRCVSQCRSSLLMTFVDEELKEKECKANLVMLSKMLHQKLKTPALWKPGKQKQKQTLVEYVSMFQEILNSSLSIKQITRLNNVISGLQEYSGKSYDVVGGLRKADKSERKEEVGKIVSRTPPEDTAWGDTRKKTEKPLKGERRERTPEGGRERKDNSEVTTIDLTQPTALESMLQSNFSSRGAKALKDSDEKILVTVKLHGDQVLVSGLSYFKNEQALSPRQSSANGTSELIIENVRREQVRDVRCKKTKSSKLGEGKAPRVEMEKIKSETGVKAETKKVKRKVKTTGGTKSAAVGGNKLPPRQPEAPKAPSQFEYSQMQLRAQHPIEAIIESSESKISELLGSSDEEQLKHEAEPATGKKIIPTDQQTKTKEALKEGLEEKVFLKDLTCEFGWSNSAREKSLSRTKSSTLSREPGGKQTQAKKQDAGTVRSLNDLDSGNKCQRKGRKQASSYTYYASAKTTEERGQLAKQKAKKAKPRTRPVSKSSSRSSVSSQQRAGKRPSRELAPRPGRSDAPPEVKPAGKPSENSAVGGESRSKVACVDAFTSVDGDPLPVEEPRKSASSVGGAKESPIVIHPPRSDADDMSFPSELIHSDSFIKYYAALSPELGNVESLLKSWSDLKFYPGRLNSGEKDLSPLVKFVLTPTQNAEAELPAHQVEVVQKRCCVDEAAARPPDCKDVNEKISLASIEKFISQLSKIKKKVSPKPSKVEKAAPQQPKRKPNPRAPKPPQPKTTDRKCYHECQRRKQSSGLERKVKTPEKKTKKEVKAKGSERKTGDSAKIAGRQPETDIDLILLRNFVLMLSQLLESSRQSKENDGGKATEHEAPTARVSVEGREEKATSTVSDLSKAFEPPAKPQQQTANTQTDFLDLSESSTWAPAEIPLPRKQKMVKIKIHCDGRKKWEEEEVEVVEEKVEEEKVEEEKAVVEEESFPEFVKEVELLDSFVTREPEVHELERRDSTYFDASDASDSYREWLWERHECGEKDQRQEFLAYWATVDLRNFSSGLDDSEGKESPVRNSRDDSVDVLLEGILSSLQDGDICRSLVLLDDVLGRIDYSPSWSGYSEELRNVLVLVYSKTKSLMSVLEENAWVKVLSLLEGVACEEEDITMKDSSSMEKLEKPNDGRLCSIKRVTSGISLSGSTDSNSILTSVYHGISNSLRYLTSRITARRSRFAHSIQSTLPETTEQQDNPLQRLRKQIQQQKTYIEFMMKTDRELLLGELHDAKTTVVDTLLSGRESPGPERGSAGLLWGLTCGSGLGRGKEAEGCEVF